MAVDAATGEQLGCETVATSSAGSERALVWARGLGGERAWAIEDCRHVSGRLERWLIARGERIVRVAPKLMAGARRSARQRGKSDAIDALAVARTALREGLESLPAAHLDDAALDIRLLVDHHDAAGTPKSAAYLARKQAQGHTRMGALRCLKRHLARRVWHLLTQPTPNPASTLDTAPALT